MGNNHYHREDLLTAIAYVRINDVLTHVKYRKIKDANATRERFEKFLKSKFSNVYHVNYYGGVSKRFLFQQKLDKLQ
jgi:hypothetical protein